jgi:hypothetical protein
MKRNIGTRASAKSEIKAPCRPKEECRVGIACVVTMMTLIISIRGNESGVASGLEHGSAARNKTMLGSLRSFGNYRLFHVLSLTAIPCRMHRISFDLRS